MTESGVTTTDENIFPLGIDVRRREEMLIQSIADINQQTADDQKHNRVSKRMEDNKAATMTWSM